MKKKSAGILLYRLAKGGIEFFLLHPGGPFWASKDKNSWTVPKGEFTDEEEPLAAARREFEEETGLPVSGKFIELSPVRLTSGKMVYCYACEGDIDHGKIKSNTFELEWPPSSGKMKTFPEIDRGGWFSEDEAREKILKAQIPLLDELIKIIRP